MKDQIDALRAALDSLEKAIAKKEEADYRSRPHADFKVGDWVHKGDQVGVVAWVENECLGSGLKKENGYFGLDIKNGNLGLCAHCRIDEYDFLPTELLDYFTSPRTYRVKLTGEDIEKILYHIGSRNCNPSESKEKLRRALTRKEE